MSLNVDPESLYDPTNLDGRSRRSSFTFKRTSSITSSKRNSVSPHPRPDMERRASYDHKRDTQFDEYVARRKSLTLQDDGVRALGAELARGDGQTRSRGNSLTSPASWEINLGDSPDAPPGVVQRGHSLNSVPEAEEEHTANAREKARPMSESRQGLLSDRRVSGLSVVSYATRDSRIEPAQGLGDSELESKKRRRDS